MVGSGQFHGKCDPAHTDELDVCSSVTHPHVPLALGACHGSWHCPPTHPRTHAPTHPHMPSTGMDTSSVPGSGIRPCVVQGARVTVTADKQKVGSLNPMSHCHRTPPSSHTRDRATRAPYPHPFPHPVPPHPFSGMFLSSPHHWHPLDVTGTIGFNLLSTNTVYSFSDESSGVVVMRCVG